MKNKITIAIVALMVTVLAAPLVMAADVSYTANVGSTANVVVDPSSDSSFGSVSAGSTHEKENSIILKNSGNVVGTVDAQFTTNRSASEHGMVSESDVILADNLTIDGEIMQNNGDSVSLNSVPAHDGTIDGTVIYNATLTVPVGQTPGIYTGNVQLTFGTTV